MNNNTVMPEQGTPDLVGHDLFASAQSTMEPGEWKIVHTGIQMACPKGMYGRIAPQSGLAVKHGIHIGAGVIDKDYKG